MKYGSNKPQAPKQPRIAQEFSRDIPKAAVIALFSMQFEKRVS
jgi:hypothetical protein